LTNTKDQKRKCINDNDNSSSKKNAFLSTSVPTTEKDHGKSGKWTSAWQGSHSYGGWSPDGLNHFNKLVTMVQQR